MPNSWKYLTLAIALALGPGWMQAEQRSGPRWLDVDFPRDSPLSVMSFSLNDSTATVKGTSLALGLHTSLALRNSGKKTVRGLTLRVEAQDLNPAGKASVTVPSLDVMPGEVFPVKLDLELLRPFNTGKNAGALVQVSLDGVLFDDLSFYGPDKLHSRRSLTVYELEARRDRQFFEHLVAGGETAQLREEMNFGLPDVRPPQLGLELLRDLRNTQRVDHPIAVALVKFPDAPVQMLNGAAKVFKNEVRTPHVNLQNQTSKSVKSIEMGWILRDERGRDYIAGSLPAAVDIGPVQSGSVQEKGVLRFSQSSGRPMLIEAVTAFLNNVEFADGNLWIPSRRDISGSSLDPSLKRAISSSPEQQRLAEIYRKKGLTALIAELRKFGN
jgi:hypothetical protein